MWHQSCFDIGQTQDTGSALRYSLVVDWRKQSPTKVSLVLFAVLMIVILLYRLFIR